MKKCILASGSPRRKELLEQIGLTFEICPARREEQITGSSPKEIVCQLADQKAGEVAARLQKERPEDSLLILGADTVVASEGKILGKPENRADAFQMLQHLQGHTHEVYTGVSIISVEKGKQITKKIFACCTSVEVYPMTEAEILAYIDTGEPMDKAGAYGIQGSFAAYVKEIQGDYNNVVGLPISAVYQYLKTML